MHPSHTYCLSPKPVQTLGYYKGKADAFVSLAIVDPWFGPQSV